MSDDDTCLSVGISEARERRIIWLLCLLAAVHVFVFSAAFPFFVDTDEQVHLDLAVKYSHGHIPRSLNAPCAEVVPFVSIYGTPEYVWAPDRLPGKRVPPPPWTVPIKTVVQDLLERETVWKTVTNQEASQPPLYYSLAGLWWHLGKWSGLDGGRLLYWVRFLNIPVVAALVWLAYLAARTVFPGNLFLRLGVPAFLAFMPQSAFYSIQNDVLSPLCFGTAFVLLVRWLRADVPGVRLGAFTGLALAATFLTKISNLPLLAVSAAVVLFKTWRLFQTGKLRAAIPALAALFFCAALPMVAWLAWCKVNFGDFTGSEAKIRFLGWTHKPFAEWWRHPIFTLHGLWTFVGESQTYNSGLLPTFWQGEILWHGRPLALSSVDLFYTISSIVFVLVAGVALLPRVTAATASQRHVLWFALGSFVAAGTFLGFLSIIYDFHNCFYPSRAHPYFTSGRLMLGALIPFLLLFVFGLDRALSRFSGRAKFLVLVAMILFMLASEISVDWQIFPNAYNWFHT